MSDINNQNSIDEALQSEKEALLAEFLGSPKSDDQSEKADAPESDTDNISDKTSVYHTNTESGNTAESGKFAESSESSNSTESVNTAESDEKTEPSEDWNPEGSNEPLIIKVEQPLPKYGKGFIFVPVTILLTIIACAIGHISPITHGIPSAPWVRYLYIGFGVILLFIGIKLIVEATANSAISENVKLGKLVTTGVYSKTRNPVYGGIIFICTSALFFSGNAFMYILPVAYWGFLTILMKKTEEILLEEKFGSSYRDYMRKTNRFVPVTKRD